MIVFCKYLHASAPIVFKCLEDSSAGRVCWNDCWSRVSFPSHRHCLWWWRWWRGLESVAEWEEWQVRGCVLRGLSWNLTLSISAAFPLRSWHNAIKPSAPLPWLHTQSVLGMDVSHWTHANSVSEISSVSRLLGLVAPDFRMSGNIVPICNTFPHTCLCGFLYVCLKVDLSLFLPFIYSQMDHTHIHTHNTTP